MRLLFLGAPGAGKGTQADLITCLLGINSLSTGAVLRAAVSEGTEMGIRARKYMESGGLVPDEIVVGIIADSIKSDLYAKGFILDGFPRTLMQAEVLKVMMAGAGMKLDAVVLIDVPVEMLVERIVGRRECKDCHAQYHVLFKASKVESVCDFCGSDLIQRADDNEETVRQRLDTYNNLTLPLIKYYSDEGILETVSGVGEFAEVTERMKKALSIT